MSVRAPRGRGARQTAAVIESTVIITLTVADSAPIVVTDSIPHCEVDEVVAFEDSYPASLPPLGEDSYPASLPQLGENTQPEEDSPEIKATQAALDTARRKLDAADAKLNELRIKRKKTDGGVINLTKVD